MQTNNSKYTQHACQRAAERCIPHDVIEIIRDYGRPASAWGGACKLVLDKRAFREMRRDLGREKVKLLERYRRAYVIECGGAVVTVAFSSKPLFH